jgi:predicted dehydrogenase/nucleoside-diphosphate-sugar epimerase
MTKKLRVALLGAGKMAIQHAAAIRHCEGAELVAVADPAVPAADIQARFGAGVAAFSDLTAMLAAAKPDVVHIVTPPGIHADLARACLEAGAHVYVEKPFALTTVDAEAILSLAATKGLKACAAHQVLFQESAQAYRQYVPVIGDIRHVESFFSFKPVRRRTGGGGLSTPVDQLIDILPHPVYLLLNALPQAGAAELTALDVAPEGEVRAVVRRGHALASLVVSLRARPVDSYLRVMGSNGSVEADFIIGHVVKLLGPGASAPAVVLKPFSKAWQTGWGSFKGLLKLIFRSHKSYPGLAELLGRFYASIADGAAPPMSDAEIIETVRLCEQISARLRAADQAAERQAQLELERKEAALAGRPTPRGTVLLTGGTGLLGRPTALALQESGWHVRVPIRRDLSAAQRLPGVEYVRADLGAAVPDALLAGVDLVVHAAAETAGERADHERNTIQATNNLLNAMERTGRRRLINISSVAVLKPDSSGKPLREDSPVDADNLARGPYVWAKATAELAATRAASSGRLDLRTIRLGPLVDFEAYTPPGRLGREVARLFVGMGSRRGALSICSVGTAARVIQSYAQDFEAAPPTVNLLEVPAPTRGELADRLKATRPDLRFMWLPFPVVRMLGVALKVVLKILRPGSQGLDLYAAFKSEAYDTATAGKVIQVAQSTSDSGAHRY